MSKNLKDCFVYSLIFALGYLVACGGGSSGGTSPNSSVSRMLNSTVRRTAIFPTNTGNQPVLAAFFGYQSSLHPAVTISNPSEVAQSYEATCGAYGAGSGPFFPSIHAAFGNSGLVPMTLDNTNICPPPISSVGADEGTNPRGLPIILSGTINTLVAYGTFVSGNRFRCLDTSNLSPIQDNTYVRAYYDLAHDAIVLGSGTTQLAPTCSVAIPAGDDVVQITVQWLKS